MNSDLNAVGDFTGVVQHGEDGFPQLHLGRVVVRMVLVLPFKLLKQGQVCSTRKTGGRGGGG